MRLTAGEARGTANARLDGPRARNPNLATSTRDGGRPWDASRSRAGFPDASRPSAASRPTSEPGSYGDQTTRGSCRDLTVGCPSAKSCTSSRRPRPHCWCGRRGAAKPFSFFSRKRLLWARHDRGELHVTHRAFEAAAFRGSGSDVLPLLRVQRESGGLDRALLLALRMRQSPSSSSSLATASTPPTSKHRRRPTTWRGSPSCRATASRESDSSARESPVSSQAAAS